MSWLYIPKGGKGKGKGWGQPDLLSVLSMFGGGYSKGKGKSKNPDQKFLDKLKKIDSSLKIWVGGLGKDFPWKKLEAHFVEVTGAKPTLTHVYPKGTACIAVKSEEEVASAIEIMNGTELSGKTLEVDLWTKSEHDKSEKNENRHEKHGDMVKKSIAKKNNKEANKLSEMMVAKLKATDDACKAWVGGALDMTNKELKDHFTVQGCKAVIVKVMGKGSAVVTFDTADEVAGAIASVHGTELGGKKLEVDVWTKREEKAEKKLK